MSSPAPGAWARRLAAAALLALLAAVAAAPLAGAHVGIAMPDPGEDARLDAAPDLLTLSFTEPVEPSDVAVRVGSHRSYDVPIELAAVADDPTILQVRLPDGLPDGSYLVSVRAVGLDGHPVGDEFAFVVGDGPLIQASGATVGATGSSPGVLLLVRTADALVLLGVVLLGVPFVLLICWPRGLGWQRPLTVARAGLAVTASATVLDLSWHGPYVAGDTVAGAGDPQLLLATLSTPYGKLLLLRLACVFALAVVLRRLTARRQSERFEDRWVEENVAIGTGVALLLTLAGTSHAAGDSWSFLTLVVAMIHTGAVVLWCAGLVLWTLLLAGRGQPDVPLAALRRFSAVATWCVTVAVGSGFFLAWRLTDGLSAESLRSGYGALLAVKLLVVLVLLGAAAATHRRFVAIADAAAPPAGPLPGAGGDRTAVADRSLTSTRALRRPIAVECAVAAVTVAVASVLSSTS